MFDVYKYIRSKDVREYNKKIKHKFNTLESCFLVWRNPEISLYDKHEAWRQIFLEMPDMEVKERRLVESNSSLNELVEKFIWIDKVLINEFYREEDKAVYFYRFYCEGDSSWCEDFEHAFPSYESLKKRLEEDFDLPILAIEYKKQYLDYPDKNIVLVTKKDGTKMDITANGFDKLDRFKYKFESFHYKDEFFEGHWFNIPTPFKTGDIVCSRKTPFGYHLYSDSQPFVLTFLANWTYKEAKTKGYPRASKWIDERLERWKEDGDISDMTASGYFLSTDYYDNFTGDFYGECMHDYSDLEYYHGDFIGGERVLLPISLFLKGEITECEFVKACSIIKKQEDLKKDVNYLGVPDEWIKKLGIE